MIVNRRTPSKTVTLGEVKWNRATRQLTLRGELVKLNFRAAAVFGLLVDAKGEVVSREELQRQVWGDIQMDYSVVSQCIKSLRRAIDPPTGGIESYIETVARAGYRIAVEAVEEADTPAAQVAADPVAAPTEAARVAPTAASAPPHRSWLIIVAAAIIASLLLSGGALLYFRRAEHRRQADLLVEKAFLLLRRGSNESGNQATLLFREAMTHIPDYPPAMAGLAESAARLGEFNFDHALEQARRAVAADRGCDECQAILGYVLGARMWRWKEALPHLQAAVARNPKRANHRLFLAEWLVVHGRLDEAARHVDEATRLDPTNPRTWSMLASVRYFQKRYRESILEGDRAGSLDERHPSGFIWAYHSAMQLGDDAGAYWGRSKSLAAHSSDVGRMFTERTLRYRAIYEKSGKKGLVQDWMDEVSTGRALRVHRYNRALWSIWSGDKAGAIAELEAAVESRPYQIIFAAVDPAFAPLRGDARFQAVVRTVGLGPNGAAPPPAKRTEAR